MFVGYSQIKIYACSLHLNYSEKVTNNGEKVTNNGEKVTKSFHKRL